MKIGENLAIYKNMILENVRNYAFENAIPDPIIRYSIPSWHGEVFNVSNIENDLHEDLIEDLKAKRVEDSIYDLYKIPTAELLNIKSSFFDYILKEFDKFVILPDIFSIGPVPINNIRHKEIQGLHDRNEYDTLRNNIVIINEHVLELTIDPVNRQYLAYNHNGKYYLFYKEDDVWGSIFDGVKKDICSIHIASNGYTIDSINHSSFVAPVSDEDFGAMFYITEDNKMYDSYDPAIKLAGVYIGLPYYHLDYEKLGATGYPDKPGLLSIGWRDMEMQPKWYNNMQDRFFVQDIDAIMSTTAIVLKKDDTYIIEDLTQGKGKHIERLDKHTILLERSNDIKAVYVFKYPYSRYTSVRPDDLYYSAIQENPMVTHVLKHITKDTRDLYNKFRSSKELDLETIIDYGYKYDIDVLKVIQKTFPTIKHMSKYDIIVSQYLADAMFDAHVYKYIWHRNVRADMKAYVASVPTDILQHPDYIAFNMCETELKEHTLATELNMLYDFFEYCDTLNDFVSIANPLTKYYKLFKLRLNSLIRHLTRLTDTTDTNTLTYTKTFITRLKTLNTQGIDYFYTMSKHVKPGDTVTFSKLFHVPKIIIPVVNELRKYPSLFINHTLYPQDYKIIKHHDMDLIILDPKEFYRFYKDSNMDIFKAGIWVDTRVPNGLKELEYLPPTVSETLDRNIDWIRNMINEVIEDIRIVFTDYNELDDLSIKHENGRLCYNPIYPYISLDAVGEHNQITLYKGSPFVNGYLSKEHFFETEYQEYHTRVVYPYGMGALNFNSNGEFTNEAITKSSFDTKFVITAKEYRYKNGNTQDFFGITRICLGDKFYVHEPLDPNKSSLERLDVPLKRDINFVAFDKLGMECTDLINILNTDYVSLNKLYNPITLATYDARCATIYIPSYKSHMYDYDLEIDTTRVKAGNISFNDRAMSISSNIPNNEVIKELYDYDRHYINKEVPYADNDSSTIYKKAFTLRYHMNERYLNQMDPNVMSTEMGTLTHVTGAYSAIKMYNPVDIFVSQIRMHHMLTKANKTYIQDRGVHIISYTTYNIENTNDTRYGAVTNFLPLKEGNLALYYNNDIAMEVLKYEKV